MYTGRQIFAVRARSSAAAWENGGSKFHDHLFQSAGATEPSETWATLAVTISKAALRIGLAQFIHEINTPLQRVYWTASMLDTLAPRAN